MIAACAALSILSGCSSQPQQKLQLPAKNIEQWVLPLDQYLVPNPDMLSYAELLLDRPCMEKAGYEWNVPYLSVAPRRETGNDVSRRIFTATIAAKWGYHRAPQIRQNEAAWQRFEKLTDNLPEAEFTQLRSCQAKSRKALPDVAARANYAAGLENAADDAALQEEEVQRDIQKWVSCMSSHGYSDLGATPEEMPTPESARFYQLDSTSRPNVSELRAATQDFACRVSSGYRAAFYNHAWKQEVALMRQNYAQLEANRRVIGSILRKANKIIADNSATG